MSDKYEIIIDHGEIQLPEEVEKLFDQVRTINSTIKALEAEKKAIEKPLKSAMMKNGIDKFSCQYMTATTIKGSSYTVFDEEQMKADGVYDKYAINLRKEDYVRINYRKD